MRTFVLLSALAAFGSPALAAETPSSQAAPALPSLAVDPQVPPPSIWKGLYVGTDVFVVGAKGVKPFFGGEAYAGYDRHFDNNLVLGVQASTGYAPYRILNGPFKGFDYAEVSAKVGYEMGRLTPYLLTGVSLAKPNNAPGEFSAANSMNDLFNGSTNLAASGVVGAGFDYAINNNTTFGMAAVFGAAAGHL